jgi:hypothetical protein
LLDEVIARVEEKSFRMTPNEGCGTEMSWNILDVMLTVEINVCKISVIWGWVKTLYPW